MRKVYVKAIIVTLALMLIAGLAFAVSPEKAYGASYPDPVQVFIGYFGDKGNGCVDFYATGSSTGYYLNGDENRGRMTGSSNNWNAKYDTSTGILYLKDYNGPTIWVSDGEGGTISIYAYAGTDNTITGEKYGIIAPNSNITVYGGVGGSITINVNNTEELDNWPCAGIANYTWGDEQRNEYGTVNICNDVDLKINVNSAKNGNGIVSAGKVTVANNAKLDIDVRTHSVNESYLPSGYANAALYIRSGGFAPANKNINDIKMYDVGEWDEVYCLWTGTSSTQIDMSTENCPMLSLSLEMVNFDKALNHEKMPENLISPNHWLTFDGYYKDFNFGFATQTQVWYLKDYDFGGTPVVGGYFPDPVFREYIAEYFDCEPYGVLDEDDISNADEINFDGSSDDTYLNAYSLWGLNRFTDLMYLTWTDAFLIDTVYTFEMDELLYIDVSRNPYLNYLDACYAEKLKEVYATDCGFNPRGGLGLYATYNVEILDISWSELYTLDLSSCEKLNQLTCEGCGIRNLVLPDPDYGEPLKKLDCTNNEITKLDVSDYPNLVWLYCADNYLTELDVSKNTRLARLDCSINYISELCLGANDKLHILDCHNNSLRTLYSGCCPQIEDVYKRGNVTTHDTYREFSMRVGGNVNYLSLDDETSLMDLAVYNGASLSLKDEISINAYFKIPDEAEGWKAEIYYEKDGYKEVVASIDLNKSSSAYVKKTNEYKVSYSKISAKEMTEHVRIYILNGLGAPVQILIDGVYNNYFDYCAADWANTMIKDGSRPYKTVDLAKALLNYGGEAQKYFDYKTSDNANKEGYLAEDMNNDIKFFLWWAEPEKDENSSAVGENGISLSLKSETYLNMYFTKSVSVVSVENFDKEQYSVKKSGEEWVVRITGITAKNLGKKFTIKIRSGNTTSIQKVCALSWAYNILNKGTSTKAIPLAKALYLYYGAANAYFN